MKNYFMQHKKMFVELLWLFGSIFILSGFIAFLLSLFDIVSFNDGISFNAKLFDSFKYTWYGYLLIILFQVTGSVILCFIPGMSLALGLLVTSLYDNPWIAFAIWSISVYISSLIMYITGRVGGYKLCERWMGKEDCEKSLTIIRDNGSVYFPLTMMFPIFPDDALVMVAGTIKMKPAIFIPSVILGRGIAIASSVFGLAIIPFERFTTLYDWLVCGTVYLFWIIMMFKLAGKLDKYIKSKKGKKVNNGRE